MALLIETGISGWLSDSEIAEDIRRHLGDVDVRTPAQMGNPEDITMIAVSALNSDRISTCPNLRLVQKLGAGVETILANPLLPKDIRVARLKPDAPAHGIAEWFLAYILQRHLHVSHYRQEQTHSRWTPIAPKLASETTVGVLGLGHIGARTACMLRDHGFRVAGWSRSAKQIDRVECHHGSETLRPLLGKCDYVCAILPSTPATVNLFDAHMLAAMKPGSQLLNAGRGDLIDESALIAALDAGTPSQAVLDVTQVEPLPKDSPLWDHPGVTITPHVSGWHLGDALRDVAENYRRLCANEDLLHEVDRGRGY